MANRLEDAPPQSPDALTGHSAGAGRWGLPSDEGTEQTAVSHIPPQGFDYSGGVLTGSEFKDDAFPQVPAALVGRTDEVRPFDLPDRPTHRRYEAPHVKIIQQTAAGTTMFAQTIAGLHYVKLIAMIVTLDADGTLQFVQGSNDGTSTGSLSGTLSMGPDNAVGFVLPPAQLHTPWLWTVPDQALGITTVTGKAQGWAVVAYAPYDQ